MNHDIFSYLPTAPGFTYLFDKILSTCFKSYLSEMDKTLQNAIFHSEGSVWAHTKMVCETLCGMEDFRSLPPKQMAAVSLAALLHDIGKIKSTRFENGEWISPGHSLTGAHLAREILWKQFGLCGTAEKSALREAVCLLIRYHSTPVYIESHPDPESRLAKIASNGLLAPLFTLKLVCLLAEANIRGRISKEAAGQLARIAECKRLCASAGILEGPSAVSSLSERFPNKMPAPEVSGIDPEKCVIMLCGLPGSGKDEWIRNHASGLPVISMDTVRKRLHIPKSEKSSVVSRAAQEEARSYLADGKSFVWNATNLSEVTRMRLIHQFENCGASVELVYLETDWQKTLIINDQKPESVPVPILEDMLSKLTPPERFEAPLVRWIFL